MTRRTDHQTDIEIIMTTRISRDLEHVHDPDLGPDHPTIAVNTAVAVHQAVEVTIIEKWVAAETVCHRFMVAMTNINREVKKTQNHSFIWTQNKWQNRIYKILLKKQKIKWNDNDSIQYNRSLCMESSDADDLICPPPPVISKLSMSFGKQQAPKVKTKTKQNTSRKSTAVALNEVFSFVLFFFCFSFVFLFPIKQPVQLKLSTNKEKEPVKKISVASAFSNDDSDDDDEEDPPVKYSRNIGR